LKEVFFPFFESSIFGSGRLAGPCSDALRVGAAYPVESVDFL
jgi:hypothetical protein